MCLEIYKETISKMDSDDLDKEKNAIENASREYFLLQEETRAKMNIILEEKNKRANSTK